MCVIGLIAGGGRFPFLVAEEIKKRGDTVALLALTEETDPGLEKLADTTRWISVGQFQKLIDYFHEQHVSTAIMAGRVKHARLFEGLSLDWRAIKLMGKLINKKTDSILGAVCAELEKEGIALMASHAYLTHPAWKRHSCRTETDYRRTRRCAIRPRNRQSDRRPRYRTNGGRKRPRGGGGREH